MDISAHAISLADRPRTGYSGHQCSHAPGRPILHRRLILSTRGNGREIPREPLGPSRLEVDEPVIAAIEGPAVAGGMELALWCDFRVMAKDSYFGVYSRRWGVPLIDGGTLRLPRIVGQGRALE